MVVLVGRFWHCQILLRMYSTCASERYKPTLSHTYISAITDDKNLCVNNHIVIKTDILKRQMNVNA